MSMKRFLQFLAEDIVPIEGSGKRKTSDYLAANQARPDEEYTAIERSNKVVWKDGDYSVLHSTYGEPDSPGTHGHLTVRHDPTGAVAGVMKFAHGPKNTIHITSLDGAEGHKGILRMTMAAAHNLGHKVMSDVAHTPSARKAWEKHIRSGDADVHMVIPGGPGRQGVEIPLTAKNLGGYSSTVWGERSARLVSSPKAKREMPRASVTQQAAPRDLNLPLPPKQDIDGLEDEVKELDK